MSHPQSDELHEETSGQQEIIGEDPWLEEFARSPYDPVISARATGRLAGLAAKRVYRRWWMRLAAFLVGLGLVGTGIGAIFLTVTGPLPGLGSLILSIPFALVGCRLIWSAVRRN